MTKPMDVPHWRRSTFCASSACIEVAKVADRYLLRDSNHPEAPGIEVSADEWTAFVRGVRYGDFAFD